LPPACPPFDRRGNGCEELGHLDLDEHVGVAEVAVISGPGPGGGARLRFLCVGGQEGQDQVPQRRLIAPALLPGHPESQARSFAQHVSRGLRRFVLGVRLGGVTEIGVTRPGPGRLIPDPGDVAVVDVHAEPGPRGSQRRNRVQVKGRPAPAIENEPAVDLRLGLVHVVGEYGRPGTVVPLLILSRGEQGREE
jgi:hypothetical protein